MKSPKPPPVKRRGARTRQNLQREYPGPREGRGLPGVAQDLGAPPQAVAVGTQARCRDRGRRRVGGGWWASHQRRGRPRPARYGRATPQAGQWRGGAKLALRAIVADAAIAARTSALIHHPTGENPTKQAKPGRGNTVAGRGLRARRCPYGLPRPRSTHPSWSCTPGTAPTCSRCRTAHRPPRAARRGQQSGRSRDELAVRSRGTSRRAHRARHAGPER